MKNVFSIAVAFSLVACGGTSRQGGDMSAAQAGMSVNETLTGRVSVTGSEPMTMVALQAEGQSSVNLVGALSGELRRLSGATVEVQGTRTSSAPMDQFLATGYRVVQVDGEEPMVGVLGEQAGALMMYMGRDTLRLTDYPQALMRPGAKVWVIGRRTQSGYSVRSFGVIRDP